MFWVWLIIVPSIIVWCIVGLNLVNKFDNDHGIDSIKGKKLLILVAFGGPVVWVLYIIYEFIKSYEYLTENYFIPWYERFTKYLTQEKENKDDGEKTGS